jgi:hypothetical protein
MNRSVGLILGTALVATLLVGGISLAQACGMGGGMGGYGMGGNGGWGGPMSQGWGGTNRWFNTPRGNQAPDQYQSPYRGYNQAPGSSFNPYRGGQNRQLPPRQSQDPRTTPETDRR